MVHSTTRRGFVPDLNSSLDLDPKGQVKWDEKGLSLNARLHVQEQPEVHEMHGAEGWIAFYRASREIGWMPTAPMGL